MKFAFARQQSPPKILQSLEKVGQGQSFPKQQQVVAGKELSHVEKPGSSITQLNTATKGKRDC